MRDATCAERSALNPPGRAMFFRNTERRLNRIPAPPSRKVYFSNPKMTRSPTIFAAPLSENPLPSWGARLPIKTYRLAQIRKLKVYLQNMEITSRLLVGDHGFR